MKRLLCTLLCLVVLGIVIGCYLDPSGVSVSVGVGLGGYADNALSLGVYPYEYYWDTDPRYWRWRGRRYRHYPYRHHPYRHHPYHWRR